MDSGNRRSSRLRMVVTSARTASATSAPQGRSTTAGRHTAGWPVSVRDHGRCRAGWIFKLQAIKRVLIAHTPQPMPALCQRQQYPARWHPPASFGLRQRRAAESKIGASVGVRQHPAERSGAGLWQAVGQAVVSWSRTFLPDSRSSSATSWRLRRSGASRSCQLGPRSVNRASGSGSRCQAMIRMELPTATRARGLPRRRASRW